MFGMEYSLSLNVSRELAGDNFSIDSYFMQ